MTQLYFLQWFEDWIVTYYRCGLLLVALFLNSVCDNWLTYRTRQYMNDVYKSNVVLTTTAPLPYAKPPFILRDLGFEWIPAPSSLNNLYPIQTFLDASVYVWIGIALLTYVYTRNRFRLLEHLAIETVLLTVFSILHVATTYPDSDGGNSGCTESSTNMPGDWIAWNVASDHCGDQMPSFHTLHLLTAMIMVRRTLYWPKEFKITSSSINKPGGGQMRLFLIALSHSWFIVFFMLMLHARYHYSSDLLVSVFSVTLLASHAPFLKVAVEWFYTPPIDPTQYSKRVRSQLDHVGQGGMLY